MKAKNKISAATIAAIAGCSVTLAARKLGQGRSAREIILEAEAHRQRMAQRHPSPVNVEVADLNGLKGLNGHAATVSYAEAARRKELALAGLRETELAERTAELMPVEEARKWLQHIFVPLVQGIRALPHEMRDLLTPGVASLLTRRTEGLIASADLYVENCFHRAGKPLSDGTLDCGGGWRVEWKIIAPPVDPVKEPPPIPEDDAA